MEIFIRRPVLACVVSLIIFAFGLRAIFELPLRQFPDVKNTVINISTAYPGANAELIKAFITTPILKAIASATGIDYITATSTSNASSIDVNLTLNYNPFDGFNEIQAKVASVRNSLPREAENPVINKTAGAGTALMYISFSSEKKSRLEITDFITKVVQPKIQTVAGVGEANILGGNNYAMRIWLDPNKLAALQITPTDITNALQTMNVQSAAGSTKASLITIDMTAETDLHSEEDFKKLVVKQIGNTVVRLEDVANVQLDSENYDSEVRFNGNKSVFMSINATPEANPLTVITNVRNLLPQLQKNFPEALSLHCKVVHDATDYIRSSIREVIKTLAEATLIVIFVIFIFLGSLRSVIIPVVTIPLSLVGVCSLMLLLGYSLNLLTFLAMVLAIGLVVDDAIVVVENIHRQIDENHLSPFNAAIQGIKEIALPIISMTITLAAVYAPVGFSSGLTGALFKEFAFTLASAVIISGIVALTLSPMMCSKLLKPHDPNKKSWHDKIEAIITANRDRYRTVLKNVLSMPNVVVVFTLIILAALIILFKFTPKELAPAEDQSILFGFGFAPQVANIDYINRFSEVLDKKLPTISEKRDHFVVIQKNSTGRGGANIITGLILKPWAKRERTQAEILPDFQNIVNEVAGLQIFAQPLPSLPGPGGLPVQIVLQSTGDYKDLYQAANKISDLAKNSGYFMFASSSLHFNKPDLHIDVQRDKASQMGISMENIASSLASAYGGNYANRFSQTGYSYKVIPLTERSYRANANDISQLQLRSASGKMVPLSAIATFKTLITPDALTQFQQLNSATISGLLFPGKSLGQAMDYLEKTIAKELPKDFTFDYAGQSRQLKQEGNNFLVMMIFSLLLIYLVLAAQFESFRDPFVILTSVPLSTCGAMVFLFWGIGGSNINIYTQVGLITLIGLISKHGILMVDFANELQSKGYQKFTAILEAAAIRLRPIIMTTAAMVIGVLPLLLAKGAGALSRFNIGLVIFTGMLFGTLFTLFVVPTMYLLIANDRNKKADNNNQERSLG